MCIIRYETFRYYKPFLNLITFIAYRESRMLLLLKSIKYWKGTHAMKSRRKWP